MGTLSYSFTLTNGTTADASQVQSNFDAIKTVLNGAVDATNLASNAVTTAKITDANVTYAKLASTAQNSFVKLLNQSNTRLVFGTATASTAVAGNLVSGLIAHGLGSTPVFAIATILDGASIGPVNAVCTGVKTVDATFATFYFQGINSATVTGGSINFFWVALG